MKRLGIITVAGVVSVLLLTDRASASSINIPPDPLIGVLGSGGGSPPATDGSAFQLLACAPGILASFFCAEYENTFEGSITSLDLSFWDDPGNPIPTSVNGDPNFAVGAVSDFQLLLTVDQFTTRLCTTEAFVACNFVEVVGDFGFPVSLKLAGDPPIPPGAFQVFSDTPGFVSIRAVNLDPNSNLPDNSTALAVPEPGTVALLTIGLVALMCGALGRQRAVRPSYSAGPLN
jgi:hypothetical protein